MIPLRKEKSINCVLWEQGTDVKKVIDSSYATDVPAMLSGKRISSSTIFFTVSNIAQNWKLC